MSLCVAELDAKCQAGALRGFHKASDSQLANDGEGFRGFGKPRGEAFRRRRVAQVP